MDEDLNLNPDTGLELKKRCEQYIAAFNQMEAAMNDGVNVQGAVSTLIGSFQNLDTAVSVIKQT